MKRTQHCFVGGAAVTLGAFIAALVVSGGWQAVVATVGVVAGLVTVLSFLVFRAASERPQAGRRAPSQAAPAKPISLPSASR
jgi:hypothetical protein